MFPVSTSPRLSEVRLLFPSSTHYLKFKLAKRNFIFKLQLNVHLHGGELNEDSTLILSPPFLFPTFSSTPTLGIQCYGFLSHFCFVDTDRKLFVVQGFMKLSKCSITEVISEFYFISLRQDLICNPHWPENMGLHPPK